MKSTGNVIMILGVWAILLVLGMEALLLGMLKYIKTLLIWTNQNQTLVQINKSLNYRSSTESMLREVMKWTSYVFLCNTTLF
jgi:hypothetical protein